MQVLKIPVAQVVQTVDAQSGVLTLALSTPQEDTRTLDFFNRPEFSLSTERVHLPAAKGKMHVVAHCVQKRNHARSCCNMVG